MDDIEDTVGQYDEHTVFIRNIGKISKEQLSNAFVRFFDSCSESLGIKKGPETWGRWVINIVSNKNNERLGVSYVFFENPKAYYVIIGKNIDGTERLMLADNPNYSPDHDSSLSSSWADLCDEESPTIYVHNPEPIVPFPDIKLTPEQAKEYGSEDVTPLIKPCRVYRPSLTDNLNHHVLTASNVPAWLKGDVIRAHFARFINDKNLLTKGFPDVKFVNSFTRKPGPGNWRSPNDKPKKIVYVYFPKNSDALFAHVMSKKVTFESDKQKADILFSFAKNRENY